MNEVSLDPIDQAQSGLPTPTARQALNISGDVAIGAVRINKRNGELSFEALEGIIDTDGFSPTRLIGTIGVTGDDYMEFVNLKADPGQSVLAALHEFLNMKLQGTLDSPVKPAQ